MVGPPSADTCGPAVTTLLPTCLVKVVCGLFSPFMSLLLPIRVQEGRGASAAQETRARRHPDEKLHAEAAGENRICIQSRLQTSLDDNSLMSKTQTQSAYRRTELDQ